MVGGDAADVAFAEAVDFAVEAFDVSLEAFP